MISCPQDQGSLSIRTFATLPFPDSQMRWSNSRHITGGRGGMLAITSAGSPSCVHTIVLRFACLSKGMHSMNHLRAENGMESASNEALKSWGGSSRRGRQFRMKACWAYVLGLEIEF